MSTRTYSRRLSDLRLTTRHPWRLLEALGGAVGTGVLLAIAWSRLTVTGTAVLPWLAIGLTGVVWLALLLALLVTSGGRGYLTTDAREIVAEANIAAQPNSLTIAGLVFAGLALSPARAVSAPLGDLLVASLCAFLYAWVTGYGPYRKSAMVVGDAMHWQGLATLLGGVLLLADALGATLGGIAAGLASLVVAAYSLTIAIGYWRSRPPHLSD